MSTTDYRPIADYAYISDCHCATLVSRIGSIDWCCMPRIDAASSFGRLLDWNEGGFCQIVPSVPYETSRHYVENTLVLETTFHTNDGDARLLDCISMQTQQGGEPHREIFRRVEGIRGTVPFTVEIVPRFDYGSIKPWIRRTQDGHHIAMGGSDGLFVSADFDIQIQDHFQLKTSFTVRASQRLRLCILWRRPRDLDAGRIHAPTPDELDQRLQETLDWWNAWSDQCTYRGPHAEHVLRSALVLKGLSSDPSGAIAAAATTSLPEVIGGSRNWDYRYSWVRDSSFVVRSLGALGFDREADRFRRFIERSAAGSSDQLQILYGVAGERRVPEIEIGELEGYRGSKPVRVGNAARKQLQLDVLGEFLELSWCWHCRRHSPDDDYWEFLVELANHAAASWQQPDSGIWEMRDGTRHFVQSKVMCWAALDRGIRLAENLKRRAPIDDWKKVRDEIRKGVEDKGYDRSRGVFIQAFDHPVMDASLLLLPAVGFLPYDDERMIRTTDTIRTQLNEDGLIRRYPRDEDGLPGDEGAFLACSFWLAECLARQSRRREAQEVFQRALATANDLLLFSEQFDPRTQEMLGNFPQALTHLSLIAAAVAMTDEPGPTPSETPTMESTDPNEE